MENARAVEPQARARTRSILANSGYFGAAAAKLSRHAGLDKPGLLQKVVVLRDEKVVLIDFAGSSGKFWGEAVGDIHEARRRLGAHPRQIRSGAW